MGDFAVGKTSAVQHSVYGTHSQSYSTTVGTRVHSQVFACGNRDTRLRLVLWEIPGSSKLDRGRCLYLADAHGLAIVADGTRAETVESALLLRRQAEDAIGERLPCVLLLNKCDLTSRWEVTQPMLQELSEQLPVFIVSARTGRSVEYAFRGLAEKLAA